MTPPHKSARIGSRFLDRWHARRAGRLRLAPRFWKTPEPRITGSVVRGRQLVAGTYLFAGYIYEGANVTIWDITAPDQLAWQTELQGFAWLDDLAALGGLEAHTCAQTWLRRWITDYGTGKGPGWRADLTGRRLLRWIFHADFLLRRLDGEMRKAYFHALGAQVVFLSNRWSGAPVGLPSLEALGGLICAACALEGIEEVNIEPAIAALAGYAAQVASPQGGGIEARNPEKLLEMAMLLIWTAEALRDRGRATPPEYRAALERIVPTLRALRHADGGLPRFHGGGRGPDGWLETALATAQTRGRRQQADSLAMGYARLAGGRTSLIVDAAPPPPDGGGAAHNAHASLLGVEMTSGRRPVIVNCGSGHRFGTDWRQFGRSAAAHSTLCLDNRPATMSPQSPARADGDAVIIPRPAHVPVSWEICEAGRCFEGAHDGYVQSHGLTHVRRLTLGTDGRRLDGEELLLAIEPQAVQRFERARSESGPTGLPFTVAFHLHPAITTRIDQDGRIAIMLRSGEIWHFHHSGPYGMFIQPSTYLESERLAPQSCEKILLSGHARTARTRICWSLSKSDDTAIGIRDIRADTPPEDP